MTTTDRLDDILRKLQDLGWVVDVEYDRQDITLTWSDLGRSKFADFIKHYTAAVGDATDDEIRCLRDHLHYFGIKKRSKREQLEKDVGDWLLHVQADTIVVVDGIGIRTFAKSPSAPLIDHLATAKRNGMTMCGNTITLE